MAQKGDSGNKKGKAGGLEQSSDAARTRRSGQEDDKTQRSNRGNENDNDRSMHGVDDDTRDAGTNRSTHVGRKGGSDNADTASRKSHS